MIQDSVKTISIPIDTWCELSRDGTDIPVTIPLYGSSMYPLVRRLRDKVTIRKCYRSILPGDIILFKRADGQYVVHRVWKTANGMVLTMGDNCPSPDGWLTESEVLGIVTDVRRGKHVLRVDTSFSRSCGRFWLNTVKPRTALRKILGRVKRAILSIFGR